MSYKLTIGVCGLNSRVELFKLLDAELKRQKTDDVELIYIFDEGQWSLGKKRNYIIDTAQGEYIAFIDDDDWINYDYIEMLLKEANKCQVLTFKTAHYIDGEFNKEVVYSTTKGNKDHPDYYIRWANAICCWRTEFLRKVRFSEITWAEDSEFGSRASKHRPKEKFINKVLYLHRFSTIHSTGEVENSNEGELVLTDLDNLTDQVNLIKCV